VLSGLSRPIPLQLCSVVAAIRTRRYHRRGKAFVHGVSNSNKLVGRVKGRVPDEFCTAWMLFVLQTVLTLNMYEMKKKYICIFEFLY
jgi:hypothetical protein